MTITLILVLAVAPIMAYGFWLAGELASDRAWVGRAGQNPLNWMLNKKADVCGRRVLGSYAPPWHALGAARPPLR
ncbi:MAG TPA: hypothetical protein VF515_08225 [Candidatus Binatia bacterium]